MVVSSTITFSILILGGIGLLCGILLLVASKFFSVQVDERVEKLVKILPGANCGACGFAGCAQYARDLIGGRATPNACNVLDEEKSIAVASLLGVENNFQDRRVAVLRCLGGDQIVSKRSEYQGIKSCRAVSLFFGGNKACPYSCLGYGDCIEVCPFQAIFRSNDGLVRIDRRKCTGCGKCIGECPKGILSLTPKASEVVVACLSHYPGKKVMQACRKGCIACKKCEKACPLEAIMVEKNLANIDFQKCNVCGLCVEACPTGSIIRF